MKTLLVAADSFYLREALAEDMAERYRVLTCADGVSALETICAQQPDIVIMDLSLQKKDGLDVLREAAASGERPGVIVLAGLLNGCMLRTLENLKVYHIFRTPCSYDSLIASLLELDAQLDGNQHTGQAYAQMLVQLGFKMNTAGTHAVLTALRCYAKDPGQKITRQLYPQVARLCGGTPQQVERAIRSAIEAAWERNNRQWLKYFPADKHGKAIRPTNATFLSRLTMQTNQSNVENKIVEAV